MKKYTVLTVSFSIFSIATISAQSIHESNSSTTDSAFKNQVIDGVEIIGLRIKDKSPFAISNVNDSLIKVNNNGKNLPYLLDMQPSIIVNSDDGIGVGYSDMRIRGTDNQRINFTINGIPINDAESQGTFFVNLPDLGSSVNNIQIQRGVGSSTHGSGNFGGAVHINNIEQDDQYSINTTHTIGSYNTLRNTINLGTGLLNNGFNFNLRLSKINSDGYIERAIADMKSMQFLAGWYAPNGKTNIKFNLITGIQKTGQSWDGVSEEDMKLNRRSNFLGKKEDGTYYNDQTDNYQQDYYQLFFNHEINTHWITSIGLFITRGKGYYNEYRLDESLQDYNLPNITFKDTLISTTSMIRQLWLDNYYYGAVGGIQYSKRNTKINLGLNATQYDGSHYGIVKWANNGVPADHKWYDNDAYKNEFSGFVKWEQKLDNNWFSFADIQARHVQYNIYGFRKSPDIIQKNSYLFFNPKVGITKTHLNHKYYTSIAITNKEPNRNDFETEINTTPKHETLYNLELGYSWYNSRTHFNSNLYAMYYRNQLINTGKINDVGAYTRQNVDHSYRTGIELELQHRINNQWNINVNGTFSQNKIAAFEEFIDDYDNNDQLLINHKQMDIALSPNIIAMAQIIYKVPLMSKNALTLDLNSKYISRQYLDNTSNLDRSINPYATLNFRINYEYQLPFSKNNTLSLGINNLTNTLYASKGYTFSHLASGMNTYNYYYPQAGIHFNLTASFNF